MTEREANCENCGAKFERNRATKRFCSPSCRFEHWDRLHPRVAVAKPCRSAAQENSDGNSKEIA